MRKLALYLFPVLLLAGCSWIEPFYIVNTTNQPITITIQLKNSPGAFPIFSNSELYLYQGDQKKIKWETQKEVTPDTLESCAHFKVEMPPHSTLEIGRLHNDKYQRYDQHFINGRFFNIQSILVAQQNKRTGILATTFDRYFKNEKSGVFYFVN